MRLLFIVFLALITVFAGCNKNTADTAIDEDSADSYIIDTKKDHDTTLPDLTDASDFSDLPDSSDTADLTDASDFSDSSDTSDVSMVDTDMTADTDFVVDIDIIADIDIDAYTDADQFVCPSVSSPAAVEDDPLATVADAGAVEAVTAGGFTDHFLYSNAAKTFKVGVRDQWGASLIFFGFTNNNGSNVIDANDTGREVQIAIYDPDRSMQNCAWNASCATTPTTCAQSITFLGWNPVQGGNRCNNGSPVESVTGSNGVMTASVVPYQWNPGWDRQDCESNICGDTSVNKRLSDMRYIQRLRWVGANVVEMKMTIQNLSNIERRASLQEFPTFYAPYGANGQQNYNTLLDSNGNQITIDVPANDGFFMKDFESPGGWVSLQMASKEYGAGIYYENRLTQFQGWQKAGVFNNVRSRITFGLPANGMVNARAYLILGAFNTVKGLADGLDAAIAPFGYLDSPASDAAVKGNTLSVAGWVLDNKGVTALEVLIDSAAAGSASINTSRPDVCKAWPGYSMCPNAGFSADIDISAITACGHILELRATDTDGNKRIIGRKRFYKEN